MTFNTQKFLEQNRIDFSFTKQASKDWVQLKNCPFCSDRNYHFGMHKSIGATKCWKCGTHGLLDSIKRLMNVSHGTAIGIIGVYSNISTIMNRSHYKDKKTDELKRCRLPLNTKKMLDIHKEYLTKRGYDPNKLEREYNLKGIGIAPGNKFSHRIIIPIYYQNILVSYQGRSILDRHSIARYRNCTKDLETRSYKKCLYGIEKCEGKFVIVTEGITKVWRLGNGAVATFGIQWSQDQAEMLLKFDRVFILFDKGERAQEMAEKLGSLVASYTNTEIVNLTDIDDPGDLAQEDAEHLMKELKIR